MVSSFAHLVVGASVWGSISAVLGGRADVRVDEFLSNVSRSGPWFRAPSPFTSLTVYDD